MGFERRSDLSHKCYGLVFTIPEDSHRHTVSILRVTPDILLRQLEMHIPITLGTVADSLHGCRVQPIPLLGTFEAKFARNFGLVFQVGAGFGVVILASPQFPQTCQ